ncbi:MAG: hypothetical protein WD749_05265 [Phycisphaerales bacterium]
MIDRPRDFRFAPQSEQEIAALRRLGGTGRLAMVGALCTSGRRLMAARVLSQHPDWTPELVDREVTRRIADATRRAG